jgi:hypothetical protein
VTSSVDIQNVTIEAPALVLLVSVTLPVVLNFISMLLVVRKSLESLDFYRWAKRYYSVLAGVCFLTCVSPHNFRLLSCRLFGAGFLNCTFKSDVERSLNLASIANIVFEVRG